MSDNIPNPRPAEEPLPPGVEEAFRAQYQALSERRRQAASFRDNRARTHITAMLQELKPLTSQVPGPAQGFISGILTGLAASVQIIGGQSAERAMEQIVQRLDTAVAQVTSGDQPAPRPPAPDPADSKVRGVQTSLALNLHQALGLTVEPTEHQGHDSWSDWWAYLCSHVAARTRAEQARAHALALPEDITVHANTSKTWRPSGYIRPEPAATFFPTCYAAFVAQPHPTSPNDPPYVIDLTGYTEGEPLQQRVHRLFVYRSLFTRLVRDVTALEQPVPDAAATEATESTTDLAEMRGNYEGACKTIANMHAAATGRTGMGPLRGVVEDVRLRAESAETERDTAYRERAHLVALLAALTGSAVIAPAPDAEEPGWHIVYLTIGGRQASWHISPRDLDLFQCVDHVSADSEHAQWDGHTTDEKYEHIREHTRALFHQCGPECAEGHTYSGRCESALMTGPKVDDVSADAPDVVHPEPNPQASAPSEVDNPCLQHPGAPVIGGMCGGCTQYPTDTTKGQRP
ncbi:hypothetical protein [Streptomyces sp. NPDC006285]|uniref:hypothetical protein n=1 Tax=Streptomyces sp. NPDC006285 TaxID=3364742 RepID=UPI0036A0A192